MEYFWNEMQTGAIIAHFVVLVLRITSKEKVSFVYVLGLLIQIILVIFLIRDIASPWVVNKELIWCLMDYLLALYFYLNLEKRD